MTTEQTDELLRQAVEAWIERLRTIEDGGYWTARRHLLLGRYQGLRDALRTLGVSQATISAAVDQAEADYFQAVTR